jgi:hypothetical protein
MSTQVITALIAGVAALIGAAMGSLAAPWSQWAVETHRLQRRENLIGEWRDGVEQLRTIEEEVVPLIPVALGDQPSHLVVNMPNRPDPTRADVGRMTWFTTLRRHLSDSARADADRLRSQRIADRGHGRLPNLLTGEINRLEQQWKLV